MRFAWAWLGAALLLDLHAAAAKTPSLHETQAALAAARRNAAAHKAAAAQAHAKALADAARAAALAQQQVVAAAALRQLETQTGNAAATLAALQTQAKAAALQLQQSKAALARLLPVMQRLASQPAAIMLAVPETPDDAIRGILIMQGIATEIAAQAVAVRRQSGVVVALLGQNATQAAVLARAVAAQQQAETALNTQIGAAKTAEMADAATSVDEAAAAITANHRITSIQGVIDKLQAQPTPPPPAGVPPGPGTPPGSGAPVAGAIVERYGDNTVAGPAVGVSYRAAPGARVVTPCAGPVLFADNFQTYGMVVIVACGGGYDFVLSGMRHLDVTAGQRLARGQPVGEMLGYDPQAPARQPVLYVELRHNGAPVDPAAWRPGAGSG